MPGPWEKYAKNSGSSSQGAPWGSYAQDAPAQSAPAGPDFSNRKGEGTYPMWNTAGQLKQVPYSMVPQMLGQNYQFDTNKMKTGLTPQAQFDKDWSSDPKLIGPHRTSTPREFFAPEHTQARHEAGEQAARNAGWGTQLARGFAKGVGTLTAPVEHIGALTGVLPPANEYDQELTASTPLETAGKVATIAAPVIAGGVAAPVATGAGLATGIVGHAAGSALARKFGASPNAEAVAGDVGGLVGGGAGAGLGGMVDRAFVPFSAAARRAQPSVLSQAANEEKPWLNLASRIGPTGNSQKTLGVIPALAEDLKSIVPQMGPTGARNPLEFSKAVNAFRTGIAKPEYQRAVEHIGSETLGGVNSRPLSQQAADFQLSNGQKLGSNPTIDQASQALRELNELTGPSYQGSANTFDRQNALRFMNIAGQVRSALNEAIADRAGIPAESVGALRERMGQAGSIAENAGQRYLSNSLGIDSAPAVALKAGMARSMPARALRSVFVEPVENWQFRRALNAAQNAPGAKPWTPIIWPENAPAETTIQHIPIWKNVGIEPGQSPVMTVEPDLNAIQTAENSFTDRVSRNRLAAEQAEAKRQANIASHPIWRNVTPKGE